MTHKTHPNLYTIDNHGKVRTWFIEQFDHQYQSVSGIDGGTLVTSGITTSKGNNQRPDAIDQATFEIEAEYRKKRERGYYDDKDNIGPVPFFEPMLAQKFKKFEGEVMFSQPKLDGIRCIARVDGLWTRKGKPILSVPHIVEELQPVFDADPTVVLDGELYNHEFKDNFNEIASLVRKSTPLPVDKRPLVQYHIYDDATDPNMSFGLRTIALRGRVPWSNALIPVSTNSVFSQEDVDDLYDLYLGDGYEGQIIRTSGAYQIGTRSKNLLKRKEFIDREFTVVRIEEGNGNWAGCAKAIHYEIDGKPFGTGLKGNQDFARAVLLNKDKYIGKPGTVRYFQLTPDGVPRFGVTVDLGREDA